MRRENGMSLVEMMVTLVIGMLILAGMLGMFVSSLRAERELTKAAEQIENGRYAIEELASDLRLAGYYGEYPYYALATPVALTDPCTTSTATLQTALGHAIQSYHADPYSSGAAVAAPDLSVAPLCAAILTSGILSAASDILVVRRADTSALAVGSTAVANEIYLQSTFNGSEIQIGNGAALVATNKANGNTANSPLALLKKGSTTVGAPIRKLHVHVYYVDRSGSSPTLKRLELKSVGGATTMSSVSIAEGIEAFSVEYGLDKSPTTINEGTRLKGDGVVDLLKREPTAEEFGDAISVTVRVLARNSAVTTGYTDTKSYDMGLIGTYGPVNDQYKRHLFSATVRLVNPASRREFIKS